MLAIEADKFLEQVYCDYNTIYIDIGFINALSAMDLDALLQDIYQSNDSDVIGDDSIYNNSDPAGDNNSDVREVYATDAGNLDRDVITSIETTNTSDDNLF